MNTVIVLLNIWGGSSMTNVKQRVFLLLVMVFILGYVCSACCYLFYWDICGNRCLLLLLSSLCASILLTYSCQIWLTIIDRYHWNIIVNLSRNIIASLDIVYKHWQILLLNHVAILMFDLIFKQNMYRSVWRCYIEIRLYLLRCCHLWDSAIIIYFCFLVRNMD